METLQLKQILPFAEYNLTGIWKDNKKYIWRVTNVCVANEGNISIGRSTKTRYHHEIHRPLNEFKPLLIPLSQLTEDQWREVFKAGFAGTINGGWKNIDQFYFERHDDKAIELGLREISLVFEFDNQQFGTGPYAFNQLRAFEKIYELHGDVDGLIKRGLALNKLDYIKQ